MKRAWDFGVGFPPRSIGIIGVSRSEGASAPGYTGLMIFRILREAGFRGRLYPINPKAREIDGAKAYPNVTSVPEPLDLVIVAVPAHAVPRVLEDCAEAGTLNVQICASGFGETGKAEGKKLDSRIREIALRMGLRVIGPNCMGFHIPSARMQMFENVKLVQGPVAFVSQSGTHASVYLNLGPHLGIGYSKVISYGNALVMDAPDFLEYLATDRETQIICVYLEGIQDGGRLTKLVRQINSAKPVIVWKSGISYSGSRAAASHTGSLAGDQQVWDAFFKQTGAIRVGSISEMAEVAMVLLRLKPSPGKRVAVLGAGGGDSVAIGDICAQEGLDVPPLSPETREKLLEFVSLVNQGVSNPMDVPTVIADVSQLRRTLELLTADPVIDIIIMHVVAAWFAGPLCSVMSEFAECILSFTGENLRGKPIVLAVTNESEVEGADKYIRQLREAGLTVYTSLRRACRALYRFANYYEFIAGS